MDTPATRALLFFSTFTVTAWWAAPWHIGIVLAAVSLLWGLAVAAVFTPSAPREANWVSSRIAYFRRGAFAASGLLSITAAQLLLLGSPGFLAGAVGLYMLLLVDLRGLPAPPTLRREGKAVHVVAAHVAIGGILGQLIFDALRAGPAAWAVAALALLTAIVFGVSVISAAGSLRPSASLPTLVNEVSRDNALRRARALEWLLLCVLPVLGLLIA